MSFRLGTNSYISSTSVVKYWNHVSIDQSVVDVGNYCSIAGNVTFYVDGNHRIDLASTYPFRERLNIEKSVQCGCGKGAPKVEHDVWIGENCLIMSGVTIHTGSVIAAGSVVTKDVPPYAVVAGNPATIKKFRFDQETCEKLLQSEWWNLDSNIIYQKLVPLQADVDGWIAEAMRQKSIQ